MANPRTAITQLQMDMTTETTFGEEKAIPVYKAIRANGSMPARTYKFFESPEFKQSYARNKNMLGATDGEFSFSYHIRGNLAGTYDECKVILSALLGKQHGPGTWDSSANTTVVAGTGTQTGCTLTVPATFAVTDTGAFICVEDGDGDKHLRVLTSNDGAGAITWTPALPSGPDDLSAIYAVKTFFFDRGTTDWYSWTFRAHGEDNDDYILFNGSNGTGIFKVEPAGDTPYVVLDTNWKYAVSSYVAGAAIAAEVDDNKTPINTLSGTEFVYAGYTGQRRDATRATIQHASFQYDLGWNLTKVEDGHKTNGISAWKPTMSDGSMKGEFTMPWAVAAETAFAARTNFQLLYQAGTSLLGGMWGLYLPRVSYDKPEVVDRNGLKCWRVPFKTHSLIDWEAASPTQHQSANLVDNSPIRVALFG